MSKTTTTTETSKWNPNEQLTANFTLREMVEGTMPATAIKWNWEDLTQQTKDNCKRIAEVIQEVRNKVNEKFAGKDGKPIRLRPSCGFRTRRWELHQKRSGNSQHVTALACDFFPVNCVDDAQYIEIVNWIMNEYKNWNGGLAIKKHTFKKGSKTAIETYGFIHLDLGAKRRWEY
jgi:hypothetical protein